MTYIRLGLCNLDTVLLETNKKLLGIDLSVAVVVVEDSECPSEAADGGCAA